MYESLTNRGNRDQDEKGGGDRDKVKSGVGGWGQGEKWGGGIGTR